ncbi:MAG: PIN domain-containing protein [Dehalococcoidia bacterium]|nr:PIN domain-containing protein [Dehalococcoidia bacterium]
MTASTSAVVDASVAVKWFLPEGDSAQAWSVIDRFDDLLAPDLIIAEVANVFLKKLRRGEASADAAVADLLNLPRYFQLKETTSLAERAFRIAVEHNRSVYDSLYVALALQEHCPLITADQRLCNSLRPVFGDTMVWLGDLARRR